MLECRLGPSVLLVVLAAAPLAQGCGQATANGGEDTQSDKGGGGGSDRVPRVVVQKPKVSNAEQDVVLPGTLEGHETAALHARATGYVRTVEVDIGDEVAEGDVLAKLVVPEVRAQMQRAQADVEAKKAKIARKQAQLELAEVTRERLSKLRKQDPGAVSQQDVDEAEANAKIKQAEVKLARRDVEVAQAELGRLRALSGFATLRAPFDGQITARELHPGALVHAGTDTEAKPIVEIARTDPVRLVFQVPESLVPHVDAGHEVDVTFKALPGEERTFAITRVSGVVDPSTRYMRAEIDVPNDEGTFRPGMYVSVHLGVTMKEEALVLPSRAIRGPDTDRHVLLARDGVLEKQKVVVASDDGRTAVLVGGLSPDARIMVSGSTLATVGSKVDAVLEEGGEE